MADTLAPSILASSVSTGVGVVIFGIDTGLDYPTLIAGIAGGATALSYLAPDKPWKRVYEVLTASLLAGYASPILAKIALYKAVQWDWVAQTVGNPPGLQLGLAFVIAFLAHGGLLPGIRKISAAMFRRYTNEQ